jgi:hypothetical protein
MENKQTNSNTNNASELDKALDAMLENGKTNDMDCSSGVCIIKGDKSIVERINKKIITEDGRQLLY